MRNRVRITTPFPSIEQTARTLGVSQRRARQLSKLAEETLAALEARAAKSSGVSLHGLVKGVSSRMPAKKVPKVRAPRAARARR